MQLQDVRTAVRQRLGMSASDTAVTDAVLNKLANMAHRQISMIHDWPWLHKTDATWTTTTASQRIYTAASDLASDWRKTLYIVVDGDRILKPKQKQDIQRFRNQSGKPRFYAAEGSEIILSPTPDTAYSIEHEYIHDPAEVTSDSAEFVIYDWAVDLLITHAAVLTAKRLRDPQLATQMEVEYQRLLDVLRDEVRRTRQLPLPQHRTDVSWN